MRSAYGSTVKVTCQTVKPPSAPVICTKKLDMPTVSGEPESWPVVVSPNPEGNAGEAGASDHVYGSTPPVPVNCVVYATPTWAGGSETLVIDINEGPKPQTLESIKILRRFKTPFIIALNKIDLVDGWISHPKTPFIFSEKEQPENARENVNNRLYEISGRLAMEGLSADRYDRIEDFTKNIALIPISAKTGEGIPDLLLVLVGLAQRFLEAELKTEEGPAKGTILEVKEEKGLGATVDVILYAGTLHRGDTVALGTRNKPVITKVKAILKPKPLDEIRDPRDKFGSVAEVTAALHPAQR